LEIVLSRGATVEGRVLDGEGRPIAGARIELAGEDGTPLAGAGATAAAPGLRFEARGELGGLRGAIPYPPARALSGAPASATAKDGRFRVTGLRPGRVVVSAWHPDFMRGSAAPVELPPGGSATVELRLEPGQLVRGRVLDERGDPIAGAEVSGPLESG